MLYNDRQPREMWSLPKVTFPGSLHSDVHVTQMALTALDSVGRWGWRGTSRSALFIIPQAALLLNGHPIYHLQWGETLLASAATVLLTHVALTHTVLVPENGSAGRQFCIWWGDWDTGRPIRAISISLNEMAITRIRKHASCNASLLTSQRGQLIKLNASILMQQVVVVVIPPAETSNVKLEKKLWPQNTLLNA